jgi:hypothetical protein
MNVWIERCKQHNGGRLSWQRLSELVREARRNGDANVTQREIDLAYGLKDGQVSNFTHFIQLFYIILMCDYMCTVFFRYFRSYINIC